MGRRGPRQNPVKPTTPRPSAWDYWTITRRRFLGYAASTAGQNSIASQGYVPLPENIRTQVADAVNSLS